MNDAILHLATLGYSAGQIAAALGVSPRTLPALPVTVPRAPLRRGPMTPEGAAMAKGLRAAGMAIDAIGTMLGLAPEDVFSVCGARYRCTRQNGPALRSARQGAALR